MAEKPANKAFADRLKAGFEEEIPDEERTAAEAVLGSGSLRFKLAPGGFRQLLKALDRSNPGGT
jgi:hypothetical protein